MRPIRCARSDPPDPMRSIRCARFDPPDPMRSWLSDEASVAVLVERCRGKCAADPPGPAAVGRAVTVLVLGRGQPRLTGMIGEAAAPQQATADGSTVPEGQQAGRQIASAKCARARRGCSYAPDARASLAASTERGAMSHYPAASTLLLNAPRHRGGGPPARRWSTSGWRRQGRSRPDLR